jgi:hypothetical protein
MAIGVFVCDVADAKRAICPITVRSPVDTTMQRPLPATHKVP